MIIRAQVLPIAIQLHSKKRCKNGYVLRRGITGFSGKYPNRKRFLWHSFSLYLDVLSNQIRTYEKDNFIQPDCYSFLLHGGKDDWRYLDVNVYTRD